METIARVPVWLWRLFMFSRRGMELRRLNRDPIQDVRYRFDLDYVGDGLAAHRLDVLAPPAAGPSSGLPVYVYFHGGGWTSGDKSALTKYCAGQAREGMVVVNANYRLAARFGMRDMLKDVDDVLRWVSENVGAFGGDPDSVVLGGDSAGAQIAALYSATTRVGELKSHYGLSTSGKRPTIRGLALHCGVVDIASLFRAGSVLSLRFVRMLLPRREKSLRDDVGDRKLKGAALLRASHFLSPAAWVRADHPEVFVTTSEQDFFYEANRNYIQRLIRVAVPVQSMIFARSDKNTRHTWQQDYRYPESQQVYRGLTEFIHRVMAVRV